MKILDCIEAWQLEPGDCIAVEDFVTVREIDDLGDSIQILAVDEFDNEYQIFVGPGDEIAIYGDDDE